MRRLGGAGTIAVLVVVVVLVAGAAVLLRSHDDEARTARPTPVLRASDAVPLRVERRLTTLRVDPEGYGAYPVAITDDGRLVVRRSLDDRSAPTRWWLQDPATGRRTPLDVAAPDSAVVVSADRDRLVFATGSPAHRTVRAWDRGTHRWTAYAVPPRAGTGEPVLGADGRVYVVTSRGEGRSAVVRSFRPGHAGVRREASGGAATVRGDVLAWSGSSGSDATVHLRRLGPSATTRTVRLPGCDVSAMWGGSAAVVLRTYCHGHGDYFLTVLGPDGTRRADLRLGADTELVGVTDRYVLTTADALDLRDLSLHRLYRASYEGYVAGNAAGTVLGFGPGHATGDTTARFVLTR